LEQEELEILDQNTDCEVVVEEPKQFRMSHRELEEKGDRLIHFIVREWTEKGFYCLVNFGHMEGNDIVVITGKDCRIHAVVECKNYGHKSYICAETFRQDLDNLIYFDKWPEVEKWLVISYKDCLTIDLAAELERNKIRVREIGYEL
jgi:hypothetical protein